MDFRCAGIIKESVVDGRGIRMAVFCQGCDKHCEGCQNQHTWDPKGGYVETIENVLKMYDTNPLLAGITISGGEPFKQAKEMRSLAVNIHSRKGNVWVYTGYTLEELLENLDYWKFMFIYEIDVLVDGPFVLEKRDLSLDWRGSSNQRVLDLNKFRTDPDAYNEYIQTLDGKRKERFELCFNIQKL